MSGIEEYAKEYEIEWLQEQIYELQVQMRELEMKLDRVTNAPLVDPIELLDSNTKKCTKCGMVWKGAMGYVCTDLKCPVQMKMIVKL
jgi:prefoldin subunit 5